MNINNVLRAHGIGGAKATGTALPADVRAGETFSNDDDIDLVGTLPVRATVPVAVLPGTADQVLAAGIYDGTVTVFGDPELASGNIRAGANLFGVDGKAEVVDTTEAAGTAAAAGHILSGRAAFVNGARIAGNIANNPGGNTITPSTVNQAVAAGYYAAAVTIAGDADLVSANIKAGANIFNVAGKAQVVDTTEAAGTAAAAANILAGKNAFVNGAKIAGAMVDRGAPTWTPNTANQILAAGFYSGGTVQGDADLVTGNVRAGANIFGVAGKTEVVDTAESVATGAPADATQILATRVAFVNGAKIIGAMANNGALGTLTPGVNPMTIPAGYTSGGTVAGDADLVSANIKAGANIFNVAGKAEVVDTTEAAGTAAAAGHILSGRAAFVNGARIAGTIPNNAGGNTITPGTAAQTIAAGYYAADVTVAGDTDLISGNIRAGANIFGVAGKAEVVDTTEATAPAAAAEILAGEIAFVNGAKVTGTMANRGAPAAFTPTAAGTTFAAGYYSAAITINGDVDLIAANIKAGANIFGIAGAPNVVDTTEAAGSAAAAAHILAGRAGFVNGARVAGSMVDRGAPTWTPSTLNQNLAAGYYSAGTVLGDADLISANIKAGANIFGVPGAANVVDTTAGTAIAADILTGKVAFVDGAQLVGTAEVIAAVEKQSLIDVANEAEANNSTIRSNVATSLDAVSTVTDLGLTAASTWAQIQAAIPNVKTGKGIASGQGTSAANGIFTVTGLAFQPSFVFMHWPESVGNKTSRLWYDSLNRFGFSGEVIRWNSSTNSELQNFGNGITVNSSGFSANNNSGVQSNTIRWIAIE